MKIGILTLRMHPNYGCILQAYALQTVLRRMGYEAVTLDVEEQYHPRYTPLARLFLRFIKRLLLTILRRPHLAINYELQHFRKQMEIETATAQKTMEFAKRNICQAHYNRFRDIPQDEYGAFVVGSDQVWRPEFMGIGKKTQFFLAFAKRWKGIHRVAYAASFGRSEWLYSKRLNRKCARLAKLFDGVTVREDDAVGLCRTYLGVEATHVLDPTMLLEETNYSQFISDRPKKKDILLCYILDKTPEKEVFISRVAQERHLIPMCVGSDSGNDAIPLSQRIQNPVEDFLQGFRDASFVITDSFHGTAFSIIFHKPFVSIGNEKRGISRFVSLLKIFGLESCLIDDKCQCNPSEIQNIEWLKIEQIHRQWKDKSMTTLFKVLDNQI